MGYAFLGSGLFWIIAVFVAYQYGNKLPILSGFNKNTRAGIVILLGLFMTGAIGGAGSLTSMGVAPLSIASVEFGADYGGNVTFSDVATDDNHARASMSDTAVADGTTQQSGVNVTVTRTEAQADACTVKVSSADFKDPVDSTDSNVYNIVQKSNSELLAYANGVQIKDGYVLGWTEGTTSQTVSLTFRPSDSAIEQLPQYDSRVVLFDVCGQNYAVEMVSSS